MSLLQKFRNFRRNIGLIRHIDDTLKRIEYNQRRYVLEQNILHLKESGITDEKYCDHDIIVSLTTYGKRIHEVHLAIESIMEQTMKANKIILWLDYSFENKVLPIMLTKLCERGLEIKYCKDILSYKKLIPTLKLYPDDAIITIDDDVIYNIDLLENLIRPYQEDCSYVYAHRCHKMCLNKNNVLRPYVEWEFGRGTVDANILNFPTGVGGILYPPHSLDKEVFNEDVFMDICKYADDVWFKAMAMKKETLAKCVYNHDALGYEFLYLDNGLDSLCDVNVMQGRNDVQINAVFTKYDLYKQLNKCR